MSKAPTPASSPTLAILLGRGGSGKSTVALEIIDRARNQGRDPIIVDGDSRSRTVSGWYPDAITPKSESLPDNKDMLTGVLNTMAEQRRGAVVDLGTGDRLLVDYGVDIAVDVFCAAHDITPLAIYVLGPDAEDLSHCLSIYEGGYFRPERMIVVLNEGVVRMGKTIDGAFQQTLENPAFRDMASSARVMMLPRLAVMDEIKRKKVSFYGANDPSLAVPMEPVQKFMVRHWLTQIEKVRASEGMASWLP